MVNVNKLAAKYGQTETNLTIARVKKLIGHSVPLVRISSLGVRGLRFHVKAVDEKTGGIILTEEVSGSEESVTLSDICLSPRKSRGEGPNSFPADF